MPEFGDRSLVRLHQCDKRLIKVLERAIVAGPDFAILCGYRNETDQDRVFLDGKSKVQWPDSKHNSFPSMAVDIAPYPIDWSDKERFMELVAYVRGVSAGMGVKLRSGADWDRDWNHKEHSFLDWPHLEIVE